jgi:hypothetical protein
VTDDQRYSAQILRDSLTDLYEQESHIIERQLAGMSKPLEHQDLRVIGEEIDRLEYQLDALGGDDG